MKFDKSKLPSRYTSVGPDKAPHRSYYYAMNLKKADIAKPFVGVVSTWNEAAPCNIALMRQAQSAKKVFLTILEHPESFAQLQLLTESQWGMRV